MLSNFFGLFRGQLILPIVGWIIDIAAKNKAIYMPLFVKEIVMQNEFCMTGITFAPLILLTGTVNGHAQVCKSAQNSQIRFAHLAGCRFGLNINRLHL